MDGAGGFGEPCAEVGKDCQHRVMALVDGVPASVASSRLLRISYPIGKALGSATAVADRFAPGVEVINRWAGH